MLDLNKHLMPRHLTAAIALLISVTCAVAAEHGPTVAYNEAVKLVGGKRVVELPPPNPRKLFIPKVGGPYGGFATYMIEGPAVLLQCTVPLYAPEACEPSTYGKAKRPRTWIVLRNGVWEGCTGIDAPKKCRAIYPSRSSSGGNLGGVMPSEEV